VEKLAARDGLRLGVETLRQWMIGDGLWVDRRHRLPSRISRAGAVSVWVNWCAFKHLGMEGRRKRSPDR